MWFVFMVLVVCVLVLMVFYVFSLWCCLFVIDYAALDLFGLVCFGLLFWRSVCVCALV